MTNESSQNDDEKRLQELLGSIDLDAPAPDPAVLRALAQKAAEAFSEIGNQPALTSPSNPTSSGSSSMFAMFVRGILAVSAAVTLLAVSLNPWGPQVAGGSVPFSKILEELRGATTLHLQLEKAGQISEILVRAPGLVRKQDSPERYQIAAGSRWWKVDEAENTATEGDSPWFLSPDKQIDLLRLLEVGVKDATPLLVAKPYERTQFQGRDCFAYHVDLPAERGRVHVEAFADAKTNELVAVTASDVAPQAKRQPPLAELRLIALNQPIDDGKFAVSKSLTEDGRIGKVSESQGIVVLRPMLAKRWTPICRETLLRPGDWLRTELRGANAVKISLSSDVELTLGPGTLVECISPTQARLHNGQVQVKVEQSAAKDEKATKADRFTLLAPRDGSRVFQAGKQLVRVDRDEKLIDVPAIPTWLAGFEGTTNNESLGSLIVNLPDGRNEPLTVGYHKVSVEIRDQIARTTIEESFVNHTQGRLEGVFHFPLPQDASISGFGMWIGNELVEADVVEKQRAREIFETILREKRDPGLLEWLGGNIFKARVFPIEPHSEKRIKIVYTQVLPLRANRYRYSYGLRSEMLRTKPLRELSLNVTVNSAIPLKNVSCQTHAVRTQQTAHSAQVEFAAQEYSPTRDFEVVCEVDGKQSDVVVIPHRRGNDGYLLVQLTPPAAEGNWQRELLPDGKALNVVLLCDTSSSMDAEKRKQQAEFVATVLSSLGSDDRFQIACADVGTAWLSTEPMRATADNAAKARAFLEERISLGWTDLDRAFSDVLQKSPADSQVFYIGDGIVTAGSTDPAAFVQRVKQLVTAKDDAKSTRRTFHSVTVGNSHESVVLKGIASIGGGSMRTITAEQTPQIVALELLNEITQPGLRDLNIEFRGLKVAAVYPEQLPNVAAGTQQIMVGRYLPDGKDQSGEIVITAMRGSEKVKYTARINLKDAEAGNSFIPRLWARGHLDQLLAQGQNAQIRDEIIGLSEEFHIITPYTSLLVLESDADRERFGVKRRYEMRDGERFFAEGRNNANFELAQAQMKRAGDWRLGLRRQILRDLAALGRQPQLLQQQLQHVNGPWGGPMSSSAPFYYGGMGGMGGGMGGMSLGSGDWFDSEFSGGEMFSGRDLFLGDSITDLSLDGGRIEAAKDEIGKEMEELSLGVAEPEVRDGEELAESVDDLDGLQDWDGGMAINGRLKGYAGFALGSKRKLDASKKAELGRWAFDRKRASSYARQPYLGYGYPGYPNYTAWVNTLFPPLDATPAKRALPAAPEAWSAEAIELSKSLLRTESLGKFDGGIELRRVVNHFNPAWNRQSGRQSDLVLYSTSGWLTRPMNLNQQTIVNYCMDQERGTYSASFLVGRKRKTVATDLNPTVITLDDGSIHPLHEQLRDRIAKVEPAGENRVKLSVALKDNAAIEQFWIDTSRHVVVKHEWLDGDRVIGSQTSEDFVEVAGSWWPTKIVHRDDKGQKTVETTVEVQSLAKAQFGERLDQELAARRSVQFITLPFVKSDIAKQKVADGTASFDDNFSMILQVAERQQWDEMWKHVDAAEKSANDKPGVRWIRTMLLSTIRRNEEARDRLLLEARELATKVQQDELTLAEFIFGQAQSVAAAEELLDLIRILKPVYERQPADLNAMQSWTERLATCQEGLGNQDEALALRRSLAEASPWNVYLQTEYARRLHQRGQFDQAQAWLRQELARPNKRSEQDEETLRSTVADLYRFEMRWADLLQFTTEWIALKPTSQSHNAAYAQHLSALVFNDQVNEAYKLAEQWMKDAQFDGKLAPDQRARLEHAVNFALGNAYNLSYQRMEDRWNVPLGELVRNFVQRNDRLDIASRVFSHYQFQQSDVADQLRGELLEKLRDDSAALSPQQLSHLVGWTLAGRMELQQPIQERKQLDGSEIPNDIWSQIAKVIRSRWEQAKEKGEKQALSEVLSSIYSSRFRNELLLPFLRERVDSAPADLKQSYLSSLFEALLSAPWTDAIEQEAFDRLRELSNATDPQDRLIVQVPALLRLVDAMLANRQSVGERALTDQGGLDKLTRKEIAAKKQTIRQTAQMELAQRLAKEAAKPVGQLSSWYSIEQAWLDVKRNENLAEVAENCWRILGEVPPKPNQDDDSADDNLAEFIDHATPFVDAKDHIRLLGTNLKQRAFTTVITLAIRRTAKPNEVSRVLKYIDAGIEQERNSAKAGEKQSPSQVTRVWKNAKFRVLIALDRPDDLERELREWIRDDASTGPWRQSLGRLMAERGKVDEAIQLFEACQKDNLLSAADYKMLADWYLVANRRAQYERSRVESFKVMPEWQLGQHIYQMTSRWEQREGSLTTLDDDTLLAFRALFEKSATPENYLWQLRSVYANSRDFRMLQVLPDSMLGRSPQQVYGFLGQLSGTILTELRNEAHADEILSRIKELRAGERTTTDLRALDLLEALVERRSSEVLNQPGTHVDACIAALQRAFQRQWGEGEPRMMSNFLFGLGSLPDKLSVEQLRELKELQKIAPRKSRDHLQITSDLCHLIGHSYRRFDEAIREMSVEVRDYAQSHEGRWPYEDNEILSRFVSLYEATSQYATAETILQQFLAKSDNRVHRKWFTDRLMTVYNQAFEHDGAVSIGSGRNNLFLPIYKLVLKQIEESLDEHERQALVSQVGTTFDIAHRHKVPSVVDTVRSFAFEVMPAVLKRQTSQYRNTVTAPVRYLAEIAGPKDGLRYVVERMEQYPQRLEISWESSWQTFAYELAHRRHAVGASDMDDRILKLVIRELKRDLRTGESRHQSIYYHYDQYFWREKTDDFAKAAEEVLAERKTSGRRAMIVARYFWTGLPKQDRAIEILLIAHQQALLDDGAQEQLVRWLHDRSRYAESIPLLERLTTARPDNMQYRVMLMTAYHRSKRPEQLAELIQRTHDHFHQEGRWTEENVAAFGQGCLDCSEEARAIHYLTEAIALHQRANPGSGLNDGTLSYYYRSLAFANSNLHRTKEAVDAASAAIVCWGSASHERADQLQALKAVLNAAPDLDDYVKQLDAEAAKTGQDSPLLRSMLGTVYQERSAFDKAIPQLLLAAELQPNDQAIRRSLMICYDATNDRPAATRQLLQMIEVRRHDLPLYHELAERLGDNEIEAERAATSIIESSPNEAENHAVMAELRQKQGRWDEAIPHWRQVAELRKLEPIGLLKLGEAQLHQKQWEAARETIQKLRKTDWPARFNNVQSEIKSLESRLPK